MGKSVVIESWRKVSLWNLIELYAFVIAAELTWREHPVNASSFTLAQGNRLWQSK